VLINSPIDSRFVSLSIVVHKMFSHPPFFFSPFSSSSSLSPLLLLSSSSPPPPPPPFIYLDKKKHSSELLSNSSNSSNVSSGSSFEMSCLSVIRSSWFPLNNVMFSIWTLFASTPSTPTTPGSSRHDGRYSSESREFRDSDDEVGNSGTEVGNSGTNNAFETNFFPGGESAPFAASLLLCF